MNIYFVLQNDNGGYDTYDSFVCVAPDEETARNMSPAGGAMDWRDEWSTSSWARDSTRVSVRLIGKAKDKAQTVICSSFNAG